MPKEVLALEHDDAIDLSDELDECSYALFVLATAESTSRAAEDQLRHRLHTLGLRLIATADLVEVAEDIDSPGQFALAEEVPSACVIA